jgi:hypothetical protein
MHSGGAELSFRASELEGLLKIGKLKRSAVGPGVMVG